MHSSLIHAAVQLLVDGIGKSFDLAGACGAETVGRTHRGRGRRISRDDNIQPVWIELVRG